MISQNTPALDLEMKGSGITAACVSHDTDQRSGRHLGPVIGDDPCQVTIQAEIAIMVVDDDDIPQAMVLVAEGVVVDPAHGTWGSRGNLALGAVAICTDIWSDIQSRMVGRTAGTMIE